jgi:hypothetical protein
MRKIMAGAASSIILTVLIAIFLTSANAAGAAKNVAVTNAKGNVMVMSQGSSEWKKAEFGSMLGSGDTIKTGADSYADLNFSGNSEDAMVRVDANSTMKIDSYVAARAAENKKIILDLAMGDIMVKANKLKSESQFQVRTPTSIVGVRGTGFKVQVTAEK